MKKPPSQVLGNSLENSRCILSNHWRWCFLVDKPVPPYIKKCKIETFRPPLFRTPQITSYLCQSPEPLKCQRSISSAVTPTLSIPTYRYLRLFFLFYSSTRQIFLHTFISAGFFFLNTLWSMKTTKMKYAYIYMETHGDPFNSFAFAYCSGCCCIICVLLFVEFH